MPSDPNYVRITNRLSFGVVADIAGGSRWSISGNDVKEFPKDKTAKRFVRKMIANGRLEPASKSEYEEVQENRRTMAASVPQRSSSSEERHTPIQEQAIRDKARELREQGSKSEPSEDSESDDEESDDEDRSYEDMKVDDLRQMLLERGLPTTGKKDELIARLEEDDEDDEDDE